MRILTKTELHDILYGSAILGTGGGGSLLNGLALIDAALEAGKVFKLADFSDVPDDARIAVPYMCGSVTPASPDELKKLSAYERKAESPSLQAFRAMEEYLGEEISGIISTELGGNNTAEALHIAATLGKYIVDADPAGRAVPELGQSTFAIFGLPIYPLAVASYFGDVAIFPHVVNDDRAETLVRALAAASGQGVGVVDHPALAKEMKHAVIRGAISHAMHVGALYRSAVERGVSASEYLARTLGAYFLFRGEVTKFNLETIEGFSLGGTEIAGTGEFAGQIFKIWVKNENLISWRNGEVDVTAPDLICMFDDEKNYPCVHPNVHEGQKVSVIGIKAPDEWRLPEGLELLSPKHFGFDIPYVPIERKHKPLE